MEVKDPADKVAQRRAAMPQTSAFIDWCRAALGDELVNRQMATAQAARREYTRVLNEQGEAAAKRWHLKNAHLCTFSSNEGGRQIGMPSPYGQNLD